MLARTLGYGLSGVSGFAVKVEVYAATGMPALEIIGLPDASVKESRDRVSAAIVNSGFTMPISRLTVNLAPADQRKEGPAFDLPIAISILMASGQLEGMDLTQTLMLGELSLDGSLHPVRGNTVTWYRRSSARWIWHRCRGRLARAGRWKWRPAVDIIC